MSKTDDFQRSYADFGLARSVRQVQHALANRGDAEAQAQALVDSMAVPEERIEKRLGRPIEGMRILELGPGQGMERARYFGRSNKVVGLDRDIIPTGLDPRSYLEMARTNGVGRAAKTAGRYLLIGRAKDASYKKILGPNAGPPELRAGDIETDPLEPGSFDIAMSWSVFEHLGDPDKALQNIIDALAPGGVLHISIHIYTAHDGHHDIRAFTGDGDSLPLWGHLRPTEKDKIKPSSYLNEWRLDRWRELFGRLTPGADEYLDSYEVPETLGPKLTGSLRDELADYQDEELLTVNAVYVWRKPDPTS